MIDLRDPRLSERLRRRTPEGRYEISDIELVLAVRQLDAAGDQHGCGPEMFQVAHQLPRLMPRPGHQHALAEEGPLFKPRQLRA